MTFNNENNYDAYSKLFLSHDTTPIIKTGAPESNGVDLARSLVFYVVFLNCCWSFCPLPFSPYVVCSFSMYGL